MNTNCLESLQCPNCGSYEPFLIAVTAKATVYDNGVDETREEDWEDDSPCTCVSCGYFGIIFDYGVKTRKPKRAACQETES